MAGPASWQGEALALGAALAAGLLIGIERGWSLRGERAGSRIAGVRTFTLLALAGGLAGVLAARGLAFAAGAIALIGAAVPGIGYARDAARRRDATSAVAALATLGIGLLAGVGAPGLALAAAAAVVLVLALREELHGFVRRLSEEDVKALARFAVIALGVLPFLPDRAMGPYDAWNPAKLWWVVMLVTGFSFLAYAANRVFGESRGTLATALIGGAYSSTAVTQSLSQRLGSQARGGAESAGIALASAVMYLRVIVMVAVFAQRLLLDFALLVAPALAVAWLAAIVLYRKAPGGTASSPPGNPIALLPALAFLAFVAIAAVAAQWAQQRFGESGIAVLLFVMGTMDVDASIVTAGNLAPESIAAPLAATAIGGTIVANMAVKIGVTLAYARRAGIGAALALLASTLVLAATVAWRWLSL
jgi:uncharacterized membrane protein (DUF4010 family)